MITFYPGPSKVYPQVEQYLMEAYQSGILSANHRSDGFMQMLKETIGRLKDKLDIPSDYQVYFVSSATECWEIIAQSLVTTSSFHIYNGAFGAKWMEYAQKLTSASHGVSFCIDEIPTTDLLNGLTDDDVICITHNETSNGTALPVSFMGELRKQTDRLIAVDATSSMAGVVLPWCSADVWYASVQKCFGLPSGLGVMVVSSKALTHARLRADRQHYNSLLFTHENFAKFQTPYTPNTLAIYLLGRVMEQVAPIAEVHSDIRSRAAALTSFFTEHGYSYLTEVGQVRSETVLALYMEPSRVAEIKTRAKAQGIILGNGYGHWKDISIRIANFPAISSDEISKLKLFLARAGSIS